MMCVVGGYFWNMIHHSYATMAAALHHFQPEL
jgi:hypothetical protein